MALPNVYFLIDDYANTTSSGGGTGSASGAQISPEFVAPSLTAAVQVAHLFASVFQRPVRLVSKFGQPPWTLVTGVPAALALTQVPSGVSY